MNSIGNIFPRFLFLFHRDGARRTEKRIHRFCRRVMDPTNARILYVSVVSRWRFLLLNVRGGPTLGDNRTS
jgi:hypothetical protein